MPRLDECWAVVQVPLRHGCNESAKADNHKGYILTGAVGNGLHRQPRDKPGPRLRVAHNRCMDVDTSVAASAAKRLVVLVRPSIMLDDAKGQRRVGNGCDDAYLPTTARTPTEVNREHPTKSLHPTHRGARLGRRGLKLFVNTWRRWRHRGDDVAAVFGIRGKHAVIANQMDAWACHQRGQPRYKVQRLEQHT